VFALVSCRLSGHAFAVMLLCEPFFFFVASRFVDLNIARSCCWFREVTQSYSFWIQTVPSFVPVLRVVLSWPASRPSPSFTFSFFSFRRAHLLFECPPYCTNPPRHYFLLHFAVLVQMEPLPSPPSLLGASFTISVCPHPRLITGLCPDVVAPTFRLAFRKRPLLILCGSFIRPTPA